MIGCDNLGGYYEVDCQKGGGGCTEAEGQPAACTYSCAADGTSPLGQVGCQGNTAVRCDELQGLHALDCGLLGERCAAEPDQGARCTFD